MIEGPVIDQIAQVFTDDWQFATHSKLRPPARRMHRPVLPAGKAWCRAVADGPNDDLDALATLLVSAVHTARKRVVIMTPYFLPSRELILALQTASLRGVEVIVLLPGKPDNPIVHWATRHMLWQLLRHNVQVLYQPAPFVHSKLFLVDGQYALIGSTNIDPRSLRLNFELGLEIFDSQTVKPLGQYCQRAYKASTQISLASLENRRLPERIRDAIAWLFSPYL
jgi:cardiolipin synthase